jgi:RimK-like ATP-grasp domain
MILLWGVPGDSPLDAVYWELEQSGAKVALLDQKAIRQTALEIQVNSKISGMLISDQATVNLSEVTAVYFRPYDTGKVPDVAKAGVGSEIWRHAHHIEESLVNWLWLTKALVINRPAAMASNNSKPYQAMLIRQFGFNIPATLVTTSKAAVIAFRERHKKIIYKSISGTRSIVSQFSEAHLARLNRLENCPTQFQEYVPGRDYRVHVVGEEVFATEIVSGADDYRYAGRDNQEIELREYDLPEFVATKCKKLAEGLGLVLAGIDLRRTPDGKWFCFEVNPSPAFTFYQSATDQPISQAIARLLQKNISV